MRLRLLVCDPHTARNVNVSVEATFFFSVNLSVEENFLFFFSVRVSLRSEATDQ